MMNNQRMLYQLENDEPIAGESKSWEPDVKTECFEFESVITQTWNEERNAIYNQEKQDTSDSDDREPPRKRRKSRKSSIDYLYADPDCEQSIQQMILDLRQQNERILRQLTPIQSTLQKTCQNTSLLVLQQLKQTGSEVESISSSFIPPPPIGKVDDFDSFESFLVQNSHAPTKESTSSVNQLVSENS